MQTFFMNNLSKRILELRFSLNIGRGKFAKIINTSPQIIRNIEKSASKPTPDLLEKICLTWPKYSLWLMTGNTTHKNDQTQPEIKNIKTVFVRYQKIS